MRHPGSDTFTGVADYGSHRVAGVILARNEAHTIAEVVTHASRFVHQIYVMDGHSTDGTPAEAARAGAVVHTDPGKGKGSAIRRSLDLVDADVVVFLDADGSHDPADIPRLVRPVIDDTADLCIGSRFTGGSEELSVSVSQLIRTIGNILMNIAINKRWNTALTDTLNGFRAARVAAVRRVGLTENTHTIEQEMAMKMLRHGFRVMNVPTHEYARTHGTSHIRIWREWPTFVWCVLVNVVASDVASRPPDQ